MQGLRAYDGTGPSSALPEALSHYVGQDIAGGPGGWRPCRSPKQAVARLARTVLRCWLHGDDVAGAVLSSAVDSLATGTAHLRRRRCLAATCGTVLAGGLVIGSPAFAAGLRAAVSRLAGTHQVISCADLAEQCCRAPAGWMTRPRSARPTLSARMGSAQWPGCSSSACPARSIAAVRSVAFRHGRHTPGLPGVRGKGMAGLVRQAPARPDEVLRVSHGRQNEDTIRFVAPQLLCADELAALVQAAENCRAGIVPVRGASSLLTFAGLPVPAVLVTADDGLRSKPAPDGYLRAAACLGVEPEACVVIEDAPAGIAAAKSSRHEGHWHHDDRGPGAAGVGLVGGRPRLPDGQPRTRRPVSRSGRC